MRQINLIFIILGETYLETRRQNISANIDSDEFNEMIRFGILRTIDFELSGAGHKLYYD